LYKFIVTNDQLFCVIAFFHSLIGLTPYAGVWRPFRVFGKRRGAETKCFGNYFIEEEFYYVREAV